MFIYMISTNTKRVLIDNEKLSTINFENEVGNLFIQKYKWIETMPSSRKRKIKKIYYFNPYDEKKTNMISNLFENVKFINTNLSSNRLLTNYISEYDLVFINDFKNEFCREFFLKHVNNLSNIGQIWIFSNGYSILNSILEDIDNEFNIQLSKFLNKEEKIESELDNLSVKFFKTKVHYMYNVHSDLLNFIFSNNYLSIETKLLIKEFLINNYEGYSKICFYCYIIG